MSAIAAYPSISQGYKYAVTAATLCSDEVPKSIVSGMAAEVAAEEAAEVAVGDGRPAKK